jgi:RNA-directed DNA polymerase
VEPVFHPDSYGYRPGKSAIEVVHMARERCWRYDWVLDLDIKGFLNPVSYCPLVHEVSLKSSV